MDSRSASASRWGCIQLSQQLLSRAKVGIELKHAHHIVSCLSVAGFSTECACQVHANFASSRSPFERGLPEVDGLFHVSLFCIQNPQVGGGIKGIGIVFECIFVELAGLIVVAALLFQIGDGRHGACEERAAKNLPGPASSLSAAATPSGESRGMREVWSLISETIPSASTPCIHKDTCEEGECWRAESKVEQKFVKMSNGEGPS